MEGIGEAEQGENCANGVDASGWQASRESGHDLNCGFFLNQAERQDLIVSYCGFFFNGGEVKELVLKDKERDENGSCLCRIPEDVLAYCFLQLSSFKDMATASKVCRKWRDGVRQAFLFRDKLSFACWRSDDSTVARLVEGAWNLVELDLSLGRWGSRITDAGLLRISLSRCCPNLTSISLWGVTGITDDGVVQLVSKTLALKHLNVGGTFITDISVLAIATHCRQVKVLNLWGCRHVTEFGVLELGKRCPTLVSINVWGMKISLACEKYLLALNPSLQLKPSQFRAHSRQLILDEP